MAQSAISIRRPAAVDSRLRGNDESRRGFYIPVILATAGIHPFAILLFARKRKRRFIAENGKPLRRQSRRKFPPPKAAQQTAAFSRITTQCGLRYAQMAKMRRWIPAVARMTGITDIPFATGQASYNRSLLVIAHYRKKQLLQLLP